MEHRFIDLPDAPPIPGLRFRASSGQSEYPAMAEVMNALAAHEGTAQMWNVNTVGHMDQWLHDFDPKRDRLIVEMDGRIVGLARLNAASEPDGKRIYFHSCNLLPEVRGRGIEQAVLRQNESRLREKAAKYPADESRFFQGYGIPDTNPELLAAYVELGYQPIRYSYSMLRPDLERIPDARLPEGVETRPVRDEHFPRIWNAHQEAFRDHWGFVEPPAGAYEAWKDNPEWDRLLTRVAWSGDEVVGKVMIFIPRTHNERSQRKRADTEAISVARQWRRKGIATALIAQCLHGLRDAGYHEAALTVDTQNTSGALRIYERMGYKVAQRYTRFQKPMV